MKDQIKQKYLESKTSYDKYLTRLNILDIYIEEFESDTERLLGAYGEDWEKLITTCKSFKEKYSKVESIYSGPDSDFKKVPESIISRDKEYPEDYIKQVSKLMDDCSAMYKQIEKELAERIELVKEMKELYLMREKEEGS